MSASSVAEALGSAAAKVEEVKSTVAEVAQTAVHETRKTMRRARHAAEDASEEVVHQMRRHPLETASVAFGVGLIAGLALGFGLFRRHSRDHD